MKYPVIILAGGKGKRIKKLTAKKPKPLVKILNKPFIEYQIDLLRKQKVKKLIISIGYRGDEIINFIKNKNYKDIDISFFKDGIKPLGTGGALKKISKKIQGTFIVLYGDSFLPISIKNIEKKFIKSKQDVLLTIYKNNNRFDKSNIKIVNKKIFYNKFINDSDMKYIDYGLSIIKSKIIKNFTSNKKFDLSDLIYKLCLDRKIAYSIVKKRFYEIGSYKGIKDFKKYIRKKNVHKKIH